MTEALNLVVLIYSMPLASGGFFGGEALGGAMVGDGDKKVASSARENTDTGTRLSLLEEAYTILHL